MIFRLLAYIGIWLAGAASGDSARTRSQVRAAKNPAAERAWKVIKGMFAIAVVAWLFAFGGAHVISIALQSVL